MRFRIFLLIATLTSIFNTPCTDTTNITLIQISYMSLEQRSFYATYPIYDAMVNYLRKTSPDSFGNLTLQLIRPPGESEFTPPPQNLLQSNESKECLQGENEIVDLFWKFYYENDELFTTRLDEQFTFIVNTDCYEIVVQLAQNLQSNHYFPVTSDYNICYFLDIPVPLFAACPSPLLSNIQLYPTLINLFAMPQQYFLNVLHALSTKYHWKKLNVVCGESFDNPWSELCRALARPESRAQYDYRIEISYIDFGTNYTEQLSIILQKTKTVTVSLLLLHPAFGRIFMVAAHQANLTIGDNVFIIFQETSVPATSTLAWKRGDAYDEIVFEAYKSLLIISEDDSRQENLGDLLQMIQDSYKTHNNWTFDNQTSDVANVARNVELMWVFADTFNRVKDNLATMNAIDFVNAVINHTYHLGTRDIFMTTSGKMIALALVRKLDPKTGFMATIFICNPETEELVSLALDWFGSKDFPADVPRCGRNGELCPENTAVAVGAPTVIVVLPVLIIIGILVYRHRIVTQFQYLFITGINRNSEEDLVFSASYKDNPVKVYPLVRSRSSADLTQNEEFCSTALAITHFRHSNLTSFLGIVFQKDISYFVSDCGERGSLTDLLGNNSVFNEMSLRIFLAADICEAILFIHRSMIGYHGCLDMDKCMIGSRFGVLVSCAGLSKLQDLLMAETKSYYPDSIRQSEDIANVGEILYKIFLFGSPEGSFNWGNSLKTLLETCMNSKPEMRPSIKVLHGAVRDFIKETANIVSAFISRLEAHAEQLESVVEARTLELNVEAKKVDLLLSEMLPPIVIVKLRNKEKMEAEMFECATLLFSDIPAFGDLLLHSTHLEIVDFLNNVYLELDEAVSRFDAYKVETINDSYVVSSGIPVRNGDRHASEICFLALKFLEKRGANSGVDVALRIGINSGPVAAGVVGSRMPRYCLFGDTMNTASRMESHGEAGKVHVSKSTRDIVTATTDKLYFTARGFVAIKGKGDLETFWLTETSKLY